MSLFAKFLPQKRYKEYFLILGISEHHITAAVAFILGNQVTIVGTGESDFTLGENETEAADIAISTAEKDLPEQIEAEKVIFAVPIEFVEKDQIKPKYQTCLEKIAKELSLTSYGFVEYPQALAFYLEEKEESPPTLLLLCVGKSSLTFSHIRVGKIERNIVIDRSTSFISDFEEGLKQFSSEILPSRIVLYDEIKNLEMKKIKEELLLFPWRKHASFLHTPKIEILTPANVTTALVEAGAISIIKKLHDKEKEVKKEIKERRLEKEETFGFIKGEDIALKKEPEVKEEKTPSKKVALLKKISSFFSQWKLSFPNIAFKQLPILTLGGAVVLLFSFLFLFLGYLSQATVNLIIYPSVSTRQTEVIFSTDATRASEGGNVILARSLSEEVSGEKTASTSGRKKIGERARGEVVIYNKTLESKAFPKGTALTAGKLQFTLDGEVSVASASETGEGLTYGKTSTKITASSIGPEGNLPSGTNFTFKDFPLSSYYARNTQSLTGGTSREVPSVAKTDQDQLLNLLIKELSATAKQQIEQKLDSEEKLLEASLEKIITNKKFSQGVGIEAKELSLSLSLKLNALVFKQSDLTASTSENLLGAPKGFSVDNTKTKVKIIKTKTKENGDISATATVTVYFFPEVDEERIKSNLSGKSFKEAADFLSQEKYIGGMQIIKEQEFPFFGDKLPRRTQNISLRVVTR